MINNDITLRPAQPDDADRAAVLLYSAYIHKQVNYPLHEEGKYQFTERLQHFFRQDGNRFSYQFIQVAEHRSEVVGLVLSFGGREEERLNAAVGWQLEHEAQENLMSNQPLFQVTNHHGEACGVPPQFDEQTFPDVYRSYFENQN